MLLHNKLIECFPSKLKEKVEIEIGVIRDLSKTVILERHEETFDSNQLIYFIEEKINNMEHIPLIKVYYPFGNPKVLTEGQKIVSYEKNFIHIKFV